MPDQVYKNDQLLDEDTSLTIQKMGPEEKFAGSVLKTLKEKIGDARKELETVQADVEEKKEEAEAAKEQILEDAQERADQIIEEAKIEADEIISNKQEEVKQAREEGYDDGYRDGKTQAQEDTVELIEQGETILQEARRKRNALVSGLNQDFVSLLEQLAGRVVREYLELDEEVVLRTVRDAVDQVRDQQQVTIVLHPQELEIVQPAVDEFVESHPSLERVTLVEDDRLEQGGCRIRTDYGDIEATVHGQIQHRSRALLDKSFHELSSHDQEMNSSAESASDDA